MVHHGYTLTSKILFRDVIETINKYAFIKNEYVCTLLHMHKQAHVDPQMLVFDSKRLCDCSVSPGY